MMDGNQFVHYDSDSKKAVPKQDWIAKNVDSQYWERETGSFLGASQAFKGNIEIVKQRFNQTGGKLLKGMWYFKGKFEDWTNGTAENTELCDSFFTRMK